MEPVRLEEIKIKVPSDIVGMATNMEIINMLANKALNKMEYFKTKCIEMEEKYGMDFDAFNHKVNNEEKEVFSEWDDLILWEGYHYGYMEWKNKYEELKQCLK
jgi:hypothetical protein